MSRGTAIGVIVFVFGVFFLPAKFSQAATFVSGNISGNAIWTLAQSPYVVQGQLNILSGATLTIEPGVVVKLNTPLTSDRINVSGTLNVEGNFFDRVYFTSYKDDAVGGDTNGDGAASTPAAQDWTGIFFNSGSSGNIAYAVIRYGGKFTNFNLCSCAVLNLGGTITMSDTQIARTNGYGLRQRSGTLSLNKVELNNHATALWLENGAAAISAGNIHDNTTGISAAAGALSVIDATFANNSVGPATVSASVLFSHSNNTSAGSPKNGFEISGALAANQTWAPDTMPYIVTSLLVPAGKTLTLLDGAVIKFAPRSTFDYLTVYGTLNVQGTPENKVYFTSIKDDTAGGDTNGDGAVSTPAARDWKFIEFFSGATGNISHAVIRYAGGFSNFARCTCGLGIHGGTIFITDSQVATTSEKGILQEGGLLTIEKTELNGHSVGLSSTVGTASITQSSIYDNSSLSVSNSAANVLNAENNWWGSPVGPYHATLNPSGSTKSRVSSNVDFIPWLTDDPLHKPEKPDPVVIIPGILGSAEKNGVWTIDPIFHTYDDLIATLEANGYVKGVDLFTLPYDWRQSNVETAHLLRDKINEIQAICKCAKVDVVAHSMGGLVARQYIQSGEYEGDVDQLIFLGTPHLGAPKAYLMWEGGESDVAREDKLMKFILSREAKKNNFLSLFDYVKNKPIPTVQQLLPTYGYMRDKGTGTLRTYPTDYPINIFLENLNNASSTLLNSGIRITNIIGDTGSRTINFIRVTDSLSLPLWEDGYPDRFNEGIGDRGLEREEGDGTVPSRSSRFIANNLNQLASEHSALVTDAEGLVFKKLTDRVASTIITTNTDSFFDVNFKILIIKILSPVDVQVIAPDGKRIGKDFNTGGEINEIGGAFYSGFLTDDEYITIPNPLDGEYRIETEGTGSGFYTVASGYISDDISVDRDFTAQTEPGKAEELGLSIDNANPAALEIKPTDITPPNIMINSPQAKDYIRSEILPVNITVEDAESGVFSREFKFDDRMINSGDSIDLFFEKLGNHTVSVSVADFVGNAASTTVNFRNIATIESTVSDIGRASSLGWIDNKGIRESLAKKLEAAVKFDKKIEVSEEQLPGKPKILRKIEKIEKKIDKILVKAFLGELRAQKDKHINRQAFDLLSEDINWLVNN